VRGVTHQGSRDDSACAAARENDPSKNASARQNAMPAREPANRKSAARPKAARHKSFCALAAENAFRPEYAGRIFLFFYTDGILIKKKGSGSL